MSSEYTQHYLELYKKYRPETWDDMVGQDSIVRNLRKAVATNRIPTLYGFFGERGTGKSSSAYLLAKSINCDNLDKKNGNPCGTCDNCLSVAEGSMPSVHFVSMANDGSVDNVRQIVQSARMQSFNGKRQVWVLDEIHNLSKAAFDSLLVPLDDNDMSKSALFIMCSTAPEKIPDTLLSRARVFKFSPVAKDVLSDYLHTIASKEHLGDSHSDLDKLIDQAVRNGRGSVRETLSVFEASLDNSEEKDNLFDRNLLIALYKTNPALAFRAVAEAIDDGYDGRIIVEQLFADMRDLALVANGMSTEDTTLPVSDSEAKRLIKGFHGERGVLKLADMLADGITRMSFAGDPRIHAEICILKSVLFLKKLSKSADDPWAK